MANYGEWVCCETSDMVNDSIVLLTVGLSACSGEDAPNQTAVVNAVDHSIVDEENAYDQLPDHQQIAFALEATDSGFKIIHSLNDDNLSLLDPVETTAIDGKSYSIHLIRSSHSVKKGMLKQMDALVVDPDNRELYRYPLFRTFFADGVDTYTSSAVRSYGMVNDRELLYISMLNLNEVSGNHFIYQLAKIDVISGDTTVIAEDLSTLTIDDYAYGWINKASNAFSLLTDVYGKGLLWSISLEDGEMISTGDHFRSSWPFYMLLTSPIGDRFIHKDLDHQEYRFYNGEGELLRQIPFDDNVHSIYPLQWSLSGQYVALTYTRDTEQAVKIHDFMEYTEAAGEQVHFFDRDGNMLASVEDADKTEYVEIIGWLEDKGEELALLHWYQWEPSEMVDGSYKLGKQVQSRFSIYNPRTQEITDDTEKRGIAILVEREGQGAQILHGKWRVPWNTLQYEAIK